MFHLTFSYMIALLRKRNEKKSYHWWQAALIGIASNLISAAPAGYNGDEAFYNKFSKPKISPPDWLFAPVWLFNNITSLYAGLRIANLPTGTRGRRTSLWLEGTGWVLFASFSPLYFGLKSPVLGAINTLAGLGVGAASMGVASQLDRKATLALSPRIAWLLLATYVAVSIAAVNKDEFLGYDPLSKARNEGQKMPEQ